jgi:hypothetical protein
MRACKHYRYNFGDETDIVKSEGFPWNAWVEVWDGDRLVYSSFQTGLYWEYLEHLLEHPECLEEIGWEKEEVEELLKEIEEEWKKVTQT